MPYPREGDAARLYAHLNDPPPAPSLYSPEVSMALDDVVLRAMSKQPADRYPSAGDLGRAAVAALSGAAVTLPERTVATGAAATVEPETVGPARPTRESEPPQTAGTAVPGPPTVATGRLRPQPSQPAPPSVDGPKRRPLPIAAGLAAIVAVVVALVAFSGSDGGDGEAGATGATTQKEEATPRSDRKPEPEGLTRSELIARGDAICIDSQQTFLGYRDEFPTGESEPSVGYSRLLVGISSKAVRRFTRWCRRRRCGSDTSATSTRRKK